MIVLIVFILVLFVVPHVLSILPDAKGQRHVKSNTGTQEVLSAGFVDDDNDEDDSEEDNEEYDLWSYDDQFVTEKDRKADFDQKQAAVDVEFLTGQLDILNEEYWSIKEDLDILEGKISIAQDMNEVDKLKRHYKERDKLNKNLFTVNNKIHNTEKKLRVAQFKAGQRIY